MKEYTRRPRLAKTMRWYVTRDIQPESECGNVYRRSPLIGSHRNVVWSIRYFDGDNDFGTEWVIFLVGWREFQLL
jgi:hypothetical protein